MTERKSSEIIGDLISSLEALIDAMDDEWSANNEGKWRLANNIRENVLPLTKDKFKNHLDEYIDRRITTYMVKHNEEHHQ
jgi:hypothetical protein